MGSSKTFPVAGILLAVITFAALLLLDIDPAIALAVAAVWIGSLFLTAERPPEPQKIVVEDPFSAEIMRQLIENASVPLLLSERNTVAIANRAARELLGDHILGQDLRVAFRQPEAISLLGENRNGTAIVRGLVRRQDIWHINRQSIDPERAVVQLTNQTAEADISRAHTDFVANASHELRTPLAAILGYVETLRESAESLDSPTSQKFLGIMEREGQRLQSLISDLMSLSRVEAEKHDLPQNILQLASLVDRAARDAAGSANADRLILEITDNLTVRGDQHQMEQVVRNLVENALKYGAQNTPVHVTLDISRNGEARLAVTDQGDGIAPEHVPHLTRRFYRTDPGRSRASGGTGLGLAIVKHIVERHRGRLDIQSQLGVGTSVTVRLPVVVEAKTGRAEGA